MSRTDLPDDPREPPRSEDPVFRSSLREALVAIGTWVVFGLYTITFCWFAGYHRAPEDVRLYAGIPDWVLFGIFAPWVFVNVFVAWFALRFVRDEDLEAPDGPSPNSLLDPQHLDAEPQAPRSDEENGPA